MENYNIGNSSPHEFCYTIAGGDEVKAAKAIEQAIVTCAKSIDVMPIEKAIAILKLSKAYRNMQYAYDSFAE